jgi:hypothetical protein
VISETKFFAIVFQGNPHAHYSILNMPQAFLATSVMVSGAAKLPPFEWMTSKESFTAKLRAHENCTRVVCRRKMTRMLCDKKIKPGEAGLGDALLFCQLCFCQRACRTAPRRRVAW